MFAITKRLLLRPAWAEDAPLIAEAIAHERIACMLARMPWPYRLEHAREWLATPRDERFPNFLITDRVKIPGRIIGSVGFQPGEDDDAPELGFWLVPDRWGEGIMVEAATAAIEAARAGLGYDRIVAGHFVDNPRTGRVLDKLGFRRTGIAPRDCRARGRRVDCVIFERGEEQEQTQPAMAA
ncbi:MAG: GNAT family N-acetyltransferase [Parasphingopyxis sp.]